MKLIIGLGNPGEQYKRTRHNVGFLVVEKIASMYSETFRSKTSLGADIVELIIDEKKVLLCKPQTFMNASGKAAQKVLNKNGIQIENTLIVNDDADLEHGDIRYRNGGSSGGHNGLQSILNIFPRGTSIPRLRIGIGRPPHLDMELEAWVLGRWTEKEKQDLDEIIEKAAKQAVEWVSA
jgi:peptidyl-tRNA hydrolase, PTH1 family